MTHTIVAWDNMGNKINSQTHGYAFEYPVVPEIPPLLLLPLLVLATFFAAISKKK